MRIVVLAVAILATCSVAEAGTRDAPEVEDPAGDCAFPPGDHYADIVAAWISDETANDFLVHIALAEWIADPAAEFTGYTLQFTHQGVQWGVVAFYGQGGWDWSTARIDTATGEMSGFNETTGSFDRPTATMSILFPKSLFPHEGDDDTITGFTGGTADFKKDLPFFIAGVAPPTGFTLCDTVESNAVYTFTTGQHTMHGSPSAPDANVTAEGDAVEGLATDAPLPAAQEPDRDTPGPGVALAVLALACLAALRRTK